MRPTLRWALAAVAATAAAVALLPEDETDAVVPAIARSAATPPTGAARLAPQPTRAPSASPDPPASLADLPTVPDPRMDWPALSSAARSAWLPRPAPPPPPPAEAAASAPLPPPAFPYQWLGQLEDDGQTRIFIASPQRVWSVVPGEVLEQRWRIDSVDAGRLQLTWLPTGAGVTLAARP